MSIEIIVEPARNWKHLPPVPLPLPHRGCPPGCVPAPAPAPAPAPPRSRCPPGFRRVERLYKCQQINPNDRSSLSPRLTQIIDNQLRLIADGQQRQQLERAQSEVALSANAFNPRSPQPIIADAARASGYALSHATSISASVEQLPAAIKEVLSVADNIVPEPGKVTYITSSSCNQSCRSPSPEPRPCTPPPPPPRPIPRPIPRPSSPYEVLPVIHVNRCDPCDPCNRNRKLDADCAPPPPPPQKSRLTGPATNNNCGLTIEIEVATGQCK